MVSILLSGCFPKVEVDDEEIVGTGPESDEDDEAQDDDSDDDEDTDSDVDTDEDTDVGSDTDDDTDTDTDDDADLLQVDELEPAYGTDAGGAEVTLSGRFPQGTKVWFDRFSATIISNNGSRLVVETPAGMPVGEVDVEVGSGTDSVMLSDGFRVFVDGTGLSGLLGVVGWTERVGGYWGSDLSYGQAQLYFLEPVDLRWYELYSPSMDSCRPGSYSWPGSIAFMDPDVSSLVLETDGAQIEAEWDSSSSSFINVDIDPDDWFEDADYGLGAMSGGTLPSVYVTDVLETGSQPIISTPDISGSSAPDVEEDPEFEWVPSGADWIEIKLAMWNAAGTGYEDTMYCIVSDDGQYRADSGQLSRWPSNRQIDISFTAVTESEAVLPWNNASARVVSISRLFGAGFTTP